MDTCGACACGRTASRFCGWWRPDGAGLLPGAAEAVAGSSVGVHDQVVKRPGPRAGVKRQAVGPVGAQPSRRSGSLPAAVVPGVQGACNGAQSGQARGRVDEVVVAVRVKVLPPQLEAQVAREAPSAVTEPGRVAGLARVTLVVEDGARQLAVVRPATHVEVVAADRRPHVVDDADLGVDVHRRADAVLQVEHAHPVAAGAPDDVERVLPSDKVRRPAHAAALVREARHDADQVQADRNKPDTIANPQAGQPNQPDRVPNPDKFSETSRPVRGGNLLFNPRAELRIPLSGALETVGFLDLGNLWTEVAYPFAKGEFPLRYAVGTGIRVQTPVFPIVFDIGFNPSRRYFERSWAFNFAIGLF